MVGQLSGVGLGLAALQLLQCLAYSCVQPYPAACGHLLCQGLLNENVTELVAVHIARYGSANTGS